MEIIKKNIYLILAVLFSAISVVNLFQPGLPPTHDGEYHVIRFYEFFKVFSEGQIYPRWAPDLNFGFGVPLFNFVYPLPNFIAALFHILGSSFVDAFKLNLIFASVAGSIFFYLWSRKFWGELGGFMGSVFYTFSPYHLLDIYVRGSVGEVWALSLFPAFLWSITNYIERRTSRDFVLSVLFFAAIIFSHNILALMFFPFAIAYIAFISYQKKLITPSLLFNLFLIISLGLGLSSIFWLPAIAETKYVRGLQINDYAPNFPELYQLLIPSWGSGFSGGSLSDEPSSQVGVANILAVLASSILLFKKIDLYKKRLIIFFICMFFLTFFLMLKVSLPLWKMLPFMEYFQFPWRFLSLEILFASFLSGSIAVLFSKRILVYLTALGAIVLSIAYARSPFFHQRDDRYYTSRSNFIDGTNSIGNAFNTTWANNIDKREKKITLEKSGEIIPLSMKSTFYDFEVKSSDENRVIINTAYFPGWTVYSDGIKTPYKVESVGNFSAKAPKGTSHFVVKFEDTPLRKIASFIAISSASLLLLYTLRFARIKRAK